MRLLSRVADWFRLVVLLGGLFIAAAYFLELGSETHSGDFRVLDGDSIETASGKRLRLKGIDAPEFNQTCRRNGEPWNCGRMATRELRRLMSAGMVECRGLEIDRFDRLLVECIGSDGSINARMVRKGFAVSYGRFEAEERAARQEKLGMWAGEFESPRAFRERRALELGDASGVEGAHSLLSNLVSWMRFWFGMRI